MQNRTVRYQGAIVERNRLLLIRFRDPVTRHTFWLIPGGGIEPGESEHDCVRREIREETNLRVEVERLLLEHDDPAGAYPRLKTYPLPNRQRPPLPRLRTRPADPPGLRHHRNRLWIDLANPDTWNSEIRQDKITRTVLSQIQQALGPSQNVSTRVTVSTVRST